MRTATANFQQLLRRKKTVFNNTLLLVS